MSVKKISPKKISHEQAELLSFLKPALRSRKQLNRPHESDCEIVQLSTRLFLSTSIDSFSDEWAIRLFQKPETLARLCVHGTLSDLVVSGAQPLGFLFSPQWGSKDAQAVKAKIFRTVIQELKKIGVPLLGGDEGSAAELSLTGVALGTSHVKPKTRVGMKPGQWLCSLSDFGIGPALGFQFLLGKKTSYLTENLFCPTAQTQASALILKHAKASMDSSDGLCTTLNFLSKINDVRFEIDAQAIRIHPAALRFCREFSLPTMSLWYGEIGDYQPIFSIDPKDFSALKRKLPGLIRLGVVSPRRKKMNTVLMNGKVTPFDPGMLSSVPRASLREIKIGFHQMVKILKNEGFHSNSNLESSVMPAL